MNPNLNEEQPIFHQIMEMISNDIIDGRLPEEVQVPSTNELARFYAINPATARKGLQLLVDQNIIYKQRGIGMFVATGARERLLQVRLAEFTNEFIQPLILEAKRLNIPTKTIIQMINDIE